MLSGLPLGWNRQGSQGQKHEGISCQQKYPKDTVIFTWADTMMVHINGDQSFNVHVSLLKGHKETLFIWSEAIIQSKISLRRLNFAAPHWFEILEALWAYKT